MGRPTMASGAKAIGYTASAHYETESTERLVQLTFLLFIVPGIPNPQMGTASIQDAFSYYH